MLSIFPEPGFCLPNGAQMAEGKLSLEFSVQSLCQRDQHVTVTLGASVLDE